MTVLVKLTKSTAFGTPYAVQDEPTRSFILHNLGRVFPATRLNMNFYMLANGMKVHIYNAFEMGQVSDEDREAQLVSAADMFNSTKDALRVQYNNDLDVLRGKIEALCTKYSYDLIQMEKRIDDLSKVKGYENLRELLNK